MILSWADRETELIWNGQFSKKLPPEIQRNARKKLIHIHAAIDINDLKIPPGNRLHKLDKERSGQYSITVTMHWRICFRFENGNAFDVEIVDYH